MKTPRGAATACTALGAYIAFLAMNATGCSPTNVGVNDAYDPFSGTVTASATISPSRAKAGDEVTLSLRLSTPHDMAVDVAVAVVGPSGQEVFTGAWESQSLSRSAPTQLTDSLVVKSTAAIGTYTLSVDVVRTGTTRTLVHLPQAASLEVYAQTCAPNCAGKTCGPDGCGGSCGSRPTCLRLVLGHYHTTPIPYQAGQGATERLKDDVRAAVAGGLDGFVLNGQNEGISKGQFASMIAAADAAGYSDFKVALSAGMGGTVPGSYGTSPDGGQQIQRVVRAWKDDPHYLKIGGKPMVSSFINPWLGSDNGFPKPTWWKHEVVMPLHTEGVDIANFPDAHLPSRTTPPTKENFATMWQSWRLESAAVGAYQFSVAHLWVSKPPHLSNLTNALEAFAQAVHNDGGMFMSSFVPSFYSICKVNNGYYETEGGRGVEAQWLSIILKQRPELVEIVTWNDWTEGSHHQPSDQKANHIGYFELGKYFISWYHKDQKPTVTRDAVFYFYRRTSKDAVVGGTGCPGNVSSNTLDAIYITTALTAPATLEVSLNGQTNSQVIGAGILHTEVPFIYGTTPPRFRLLRNGQPIATGEGPYPIVKSLPGNVADANVYSGWIMSGGLSSTDWTPSTPITWFAE